MHKAGARCVECSDGDTQQSHCFFISLLFILLPSGETPVSVSLKDELHVCRGLLKMSPSDIVDILVYVLYVVHTMKSHNDTFPRI
jgi:hypothetical protein